MTRAFVYIPTRLCLAGLLAALLGTAALRADTNSPDARLLRTINAGLRERWGVEVSALRLSAGGYMVDFRYKVTDPEKAALLTDLSTKAYLIDEVSGRALTVPTPPKVGSLRQSGSELKTGHIYFMIFSNTDRIVQSGSEVSIVIGEFRAEHLKVR